MSKTKIEIKSKLGSVLFEFEKEDNTVKDTLEQAISSDADLCGADLCGANLCGADLRDATIDYSDDDLDESTVRNNFIEKTGLEACETTLLHNVRSISRWYYSRWANLVKIKSWKHKESEENTETASVKPTDDSVFVEIPAERSLAEREVIALERIAKALEEKK